MACGREHILRRLGKSRFWSMSHVCTTGSAFGLCLQGQAPIPERLCHEPRGAGGGSGERSTPETDRPGATRTQRPHPRAPRAPDTRPPPNQSGPAVALQEQHLLEEVSRAQAWRGVDRGARGSAPPAEVPPVGVSPPPPPPPLDPPLLLQHAAPAPPATIIQQVPQPPLLVQPPAPQASRSRRAGSIKEGFLPLIDF